LEENFLNFCKAFFLFPLALAFYLLVSYNPSSFSIVCFSRRSTLFTL